MVLLTENCKIGKPALLKFGQWSSLQWMWYSVIDTGYRQDFWVDARVYFLAWVMYSREVISV